MKWFKCIKPGCMNRHFLFMAAALLMMAQSALAAQWSDQSLGYRFGTQFREPGIDGNVQKNIVSYTSVNGYAHGSDFANLDILFSNDKDPAHGGDMGATELYFVYNHEFGYGKIVNGKPFDYGILKDISLKVGTDLSAKNTDFAANKDAIYAGPTLNLSVPTPTPGFVDISVMAYKEWGHNGIVAKQVSFDPTYMLSAAWGIPFNAVSVPFKFKGFANFVGAKGKDGFGADTKPELLVNSFLMADIGVPMGGKANFAWLGVGLEYWNNKFGNANTSKTNEPTICPMISLELHPF